LPNIDYIDKLFKYCGVLLPSSQKIFSGVLKCCAALWQQQMVAAAVAKLDLHDN